MIGRTRGDLVVCFDGDQSFKREIIDIEITDARNLTLFGRATTAAENDRSRGPVATSAASI
jgi:hypothetical protein